MAKPVIFAAVTTMIAFSPTLFIEGAAAKMTMPLSIVVILALAFSLIDAFFHPAGTPVAFETGGRREARFAGSIAAENRGRAERFQHRSLPAVSAESH